MLMLSDVRDYLATLNISKVCSGKLDTKLKNVVCVYNRKTSMPPRKCIGADSSYEIKPISILVHWNENQRESERKACELYEVLQAQEDMYIGDTKIYILSMLQNEPIDLGTDDKGIYEYAIEIDLYYKNRKEG